MKLLKWFKELFYIVGNYRINQESRTREMLILGNQIARLEQIIKERTTIGADLHYKGDNFIVVVGTYNNISYVETYKIQAKDFYHILQILKEMKKYGEVRHIDCPPVMKFVFEKEL